MMIFGFYPQGEERHPSLSSFLKCLLEKIFSFLVAAEDGNQRASQKHPELIEGCFFYIKQVPELVIF